MAAGHIWPTLPIPHPPIIKVLKDQVTGETPLQKGLIDLGAKDNATNVRTHTSPPVPRPPINNALEVQAVAEAPPPKDLTELGETEGESNKKKTSKRRAVELMPVTAADHRLAVLARVG